MGWTLWRDCGTLCQGPWPTHWGPFCEDWKGQRPFQTSKDLDEEPRVGYSKKTLMNKTPWQQTGMNPNVEGLHLCQYVMCWCHNHMFSHVTVPHSNRNCHHISLILSIYCESPFTILYQNLISRINLAGLSWQTYRLKKAKQFSDNSFGSMWSEDQNSHNGSP